MELINYYAAVVFVKDIELSKQFYTQQLNCKIEHDFGKNVTFFGGLSIWEISAAHIIPNKTDVVGAKGNKFELYFETVDIQQTYKQLKALDIKFVHDIHEEPWGQYTIRFYDPDNHLIEIGESLKTFINRWYNSGMSMEQVVNKTGVPIETVTMLINE